ncbi:MAG TPA: YbaB/EbfC family nucleoid-associated protein [Saprospiraceae bacterium]|nr:YbaB/EbfC family nucleoid-associated protein [Saprospiraceae bacterium]MCB9327587.1 YbaB/EbfC family nucleoid-associated protein [Lewinellaceae bacterium]HPK09715.1 YbaB/EbfC family nucleoid-associated protein [Saprospiraceae bacterium]HRX27805.1 YbaB/EbfC family nucleoid-associated protein [Saprospiraceae bacterium]
MFGDLMGDLSRKQEEMKERLKTIKVTETIDGITLEANANRELQNVSIVDETIMEDKERLEDTIVVAFNRLNNKITETEVLESQKLMAELMPEGFEDLFN